MENQGKMETVKAWMPYSTIDTYFAILHVMVHLKRATFDEFKVAAQKSDYASYFVTTNGSLAETTKGERVMDAIRQLETAGFLVLERNGEKIMAISLP